jgi:hypothetical protein
LSGVSVERRWAGGLSLVQVRSEAEAEAARHTERAVEALQLQALGAEQRVTAAEAEARARAQVSEERTQALEARAEQLAQASAVSEPSDRPAQLTPRSADPERLALH